MQSAANPLWSGLASLVRLGLLEQRLEFGACLVARGLRLRARAAEQSLELRARIGGAIRALRATGERGATEIEVLAEVPAVLLHHRIGHRLGAGVVVRRVVVAALHAR